MSCDIGGHFDSLRIQVPLKEEDDWSWKGREIHLMTVSRFGYQVSFHLQFQKTRVPKSVTIFPDQSWIHIPATLKSPFYGLHQVSPEFHALSHPQGASALYRCHPEPQEWPRCKPSLEVRAVQDSEPGSSCYDLIPQNWPTWTISMRVGLIKILRLHV